MVATYDEVKDIPNKPHKYLFDVRNEDERTKTGVIPSSIHIPIAELDDALKLEDMDFKLKYNREKPSEDAEMIFHCMAGMRAKRATDLAKSHGFKNAKCYEGSWNDWAKQEGL